MEARLPFPPMESNTLVVATIRRQLRSRDRPGADTNFSTIAAHGPFDNVLYDSSGSHSGMHSTMRRATTTPIALSLTVMTLYESMLLHISALKLYTKPDGRDQAGGGHRQDGAVGTVEKDIPLLFGALPRAEERVSLPERETGIKRTVDASRRLQRHQAKDCGARRLRERTDRFPPIVLRPDPIALDERAGFGENQGGVWPSSGVFP
ncbi:MAG: hypothetical protein FD149_1007 [Rhodospirillaceae bacterium]|nr:MAG: hypothetical protein FD149_1007 [Rhodospirillaceae bacterium]